MKNFFLQALWGAVLILGCVQANAQTTYPLTDQNYGGTITFTNTLGTSELVGTMIVFEGQLEATIPVGAELNPTTGFDVAALRLLAQIKLFDVLPASNDVGNVQGAVAALRTAPESSTGQYYVWGTTNTATPVMEWVPLYQKDTTTPYTVADGATNYITFVFNYTDLTNSPPGKVSYQVFIGTTPTSQVASEAVDTLTTATQGINGVSMLGTGGLESFATASGAIGPLSASISFSAYATSAGILLSVDTVAEQGPGTLSVFAMINGVKTLINSVAVKGSGSNHYELYDIHGLLSQNTPYTFIVEDEMGHEYTLGGVEIKAIKMDSVVMTPQEMTVTFNAEAGRSYQVFVAESPNAATWTAEYVRYEIEGGFIEEASSEAFTANSNRVTVKIPISRTKGFFKIVKKN